MRLAIKNDNRQQDTRVERIEKIKGGKVWEKRSEENKKRDEKVIRSRSEKSINNHLFMVGDENIREGGESRTLIREGVRGEKKIFFLSSQVSGNNNKR